MKENLIEENGKNQSELSKEGIRLIYLNNDPNMDQNDKEKNMRTPERAAKVSGWIG